MPVAGNPIAEQHTSYPIDGSPDAALDRIERALRSRPGAVKIDRRPQRLDATLGSQSLFRIWGLWGPGRHQFPTRVTAAVDAAGTEIELALREDAGWYAFSNRLAERLYLSQFGEIANAVRDELNGIVATPSSGRPGQPSLGRSRALSIAGVALIVVFAGGLFTIGILLLR